MSRNNAKQLIRKVLLSEKLKAQLCQIIDETTIELKIFDKKNCKPFKIDVNLPTINLN